jgi:hypothetical protein
MTDFDYYGAIKDVLAREAGAVEQFRNGNEKAFTYLYGKVSNEPWSTYMICVGKPVTIGHKLDPKDIRKIMVEIICDRKRYL